MNERQVAGHKARSRGYRAELQARRRHEANGAVVARFATSRGLSLEGHGFGDLLVVYPNLTLVVDVKNQKPTPKELNEACDLVGKLPHPPNLGYILEYEDRKVKRVIHFVAVCADGSTFTPNLSSACEEWQKPC